MQQPSARRRERRPPKPLDTSSLEELALTYVARFATSAGKLERYLRRKLRERGWAEESADGGEAVTAIVERFIAQAYVDDEGFAHGRSRSLTRRGYGPRRVEAALREAGIAEEVRQAARPHERRQRQAALDLARKRGFGPWNRAEERDEDAPRSFEQLAADRAARDKQLAAMLRAGHSFEVARTVLEFTSELEAERWVDEAEELDTC